MRAGLVRFDTTDTMGMMAWQGADPKREEEELAPVATSFREPVAVEASCWHSREEAALVQGNLVDYRTSFKGRLPESVALF
jgi:hypothetical protein